MRYSTVRYGNYSLVVSYRIVSYRIVPVVYCCNDYCRAVRYKYRTNGAQHYTGFATQGLRNPGASKATPTNTVFFIPKSRVPAGRTELNCHLCPQCLRHRVQKRKMDSFIHSFQHRTRTNSSVSGRQPHLYYHGPLQEGLETTTQCTGTVRYCKMFSYY